MNIKGVCNFIQPYALESGNEEKFLNDWFTAIDAEIEDDFDHKLSEMVWAAENPELIEKRKREKEARDKAEQAAKDGIELPEEKGMLNFWPFK
jgi:hypothetical protein